MFKQMSQVGPTWLFLLGSVFLLSTSSPGCNSGPRTRGGGGGGGSTGEGEGEGQVEGEGEGAADSGIPEDGSLPGPDAGPPPCSPEHPAGLCPAGEQCAAGRCTPPACSPAHPAGACAGDLTCVDGECLPPPCDVEHPTGRCGDGLTCRAGVCEAAALVLTELQLTRDGAAPGEADGPGDDNGIPDAGEVIGLRVGIKNLSEIAYLGLGGTLASDDPVVAELLPTGQTLAFPELRPGAAGASEGEFFLRLGRQVADGTVAPLRLVLRDSRYGEVETIPLRIGIRQGVALGAAQVFVDDDRLGASRGDGDRRIDSGETVELQIDLANAGAVPLPLPPLPGDLEARVFESMWVEFELASRAPFLESLAPEEPIRFEGALAAGTNAPGAAKLVLQIANDAPARERGCLEFRFLLGAGPEPLYRFTEIRCLAIAGELGGVCQPQPETCNELDDDCDSEADEELQKNACGKCGPLPPEECNGADDNCNGQTDEGLDARRAPAGTCPDRPGVCQQATPTCQGRGGWVCVPAPRYENGQEQSCDGLDNDCDGQADEGLTAPAGTCPTRGVCRNAAAAVCRGAQGWGCNYPANHEDPERSCDGLDNDCDGQTDEGLTAPANTCNRPGVCRTGTATCRGARGWECVLPASHQDPERSCDGLDNDCDGQTDEGLTAPAGTCPDLGVCRGAASPACGGAQGWSCRFPATYQQREQSCDGLDNDCDGQTDEALTAPAGVCDRPGVCATGTATCRAARGWECVLPATYEATEQACDGLDNDCDGTTDEGMPLNGCGFCGPEPPEGCPGSCSRPAELRSGVPRTMDTARGEDQVGVCGKGPGTREIVYRLQVAERSRVTLDVNQDALDVLLELRRVCGDPASTIRCEDDPAHLEEILEPGEYFVLVEAYGNGRTGSFTLRATVEPILPPPPNNTCDAPVELTAGQAVVGDLGPALDLTASLAETEWWGTFGTPELIYSFTLAEAAWVELEVEPQFFPHLYLRSTCDNPNAERGDTFAHQLSGLLYPGTYYLFVSAEAWPEVGTFTVTLRLDPPPPGNGAMDCGYVGEIVPGTPIVGSTDFALNNYSSELCTYGPGGNLGPELVYRLRLEQRQRVVAELRPEGWDPALYVQSACQHDPDGQFLLDCQQGDRPVVNQVFDPGDYFFFIDSLEIGSGPFTFLVQLSPP